MTAGSLLRPIYWSLARADLAKKDVVMAGIIRAFPRSSIVGRGDPFSTLVRSIVGQQLSVQAAASIWLRVVDVAPQMLPGQVLDAGDAQLRRCGLSQRKVEYVNDLAMAFIDGRLRLRDWADMDDELIIADLTQVRGIGRWTAEMFLMFNLLRPDILPLDDLGVKKAIGHYYFLGERVSRECLSALTERWRPWRSVATWYLWRSLEPVPGGY